jgi:hypothetical protein
MRIVSLTLLTASAIACGDRGEAQWEDQLQSLAREVIPGVERAVGLPFKYPPAVAVRSREAVREYLISQLAKDLPPEEIERLTLAYRLFGLIPDTLDLESLLLDLYTEQVVGYYDPVSDSLFVVGGADPVELRLIVAHELVHALQAQYLPLDSLLSAKGDNDRRTASQAVLEGQGILASLVALMPDQDFSVMPEFWREYRQGVRQQQERMPVFRTAPTIIRETVIFPYLGGADFVRWFIKEYPDTVPFGPRMPTSTEQILHTSRYRVGDMPLSLEFSDAEPIVYDDGLGEFETRVLVSVLSGSESMGAATAQGWGGDRYAVIEAGAGHALVWWTVWDTPQASRRFATVLEREWRGREGSSQREFRVEQTVLGDYPAVLLMDTPRGWLERTVPPQVDIR